MGDKREMDDVVEAVAVVLVSVVSKIIAEWSTVDVHARLTGADPHKGDVELPRELFFRLAIGVVKQGWRATLASKINFLAVGGNNIIERKVVKTSHGGDVPSDLAKHDVRGTVRNVPIQRDFKIRQRWPEK